MAGHRAFVTIFLICITAVSALPKTLEPQRLEKIDRKEIGHRIAALFPRRPVIITTDPRIGFYAKGEIVSLGAVDSPQIDTFTKLLEYARENRVDIIVMDKKLVNVEGEFGELARDLFAHSNHSGLQLIFVYPPENPMKNQAKASIFYVYRLTGEKNSAEKKK